MAVPNAERSLATLRIAGCPGSVADRRYAMKDIAAGYSHDPVHVTIGDWMSEGNMTTLAAQKSMVPLRLQGAGGTYEPSFLEALEPAISDIARYKFRVAVNAGVTNTKALYDAVVVHTGSTPWERSDLEKLANALVADRLIEYSMYVTGGNYSGFKSLESKSGEIVVTKTKKLGRRTILNGIHFEQLDTDRVLVTGVKADLPPPTTKVGITAHGGYQVEVHWFMVGLDINAIARMLEAQIRNELALHRSKFLQTRVHEERQLAREPDKSEQRNGRCQGLRPIVASR
ncbi:uncharacterized protein Z518_09128 [Rhinocladiella mackenziei CBS 650.93]|uniref:Rhinocladiella mackenziei CBS 650.93 unplaced genomic scaffold supercont1.7, whole genome shotgun sequence n=1 Tax=Rhinocladiella mackenziei CBS 650.93 TaxID=1442369 RepID=A0A0D2FHA3_9EURO|nr:uncharacterized protein Z518_09128 [Rhinocladiella mackenziei CBS 650.93]KIX01402.1 hypothetical protein Z518_09128 [Rhinocladiella mackenziei CBS 650.93]